MGRGASLATTSAPGRARFRIDAAANDRTFAHIAVILPRSGSVCPGAFAIVDGTFDADFIIGNGWILQNKHTGAGWVVRGAGSRWNPDTETRFAYADIAGADNMAQILRDNFQTQGDVTLRFDVVNSAGKTLEVYFYGVNEEFNLNLFDTGGPRTGGPTVIAHTVLVNGASFNSAAPDWELNQVTLPVPSGGFLYYGIVSRTAGLGRKDVQRVDNVRFD